ncbi:MAG: metal-dependent hydrolase [Chloroflexi bacterium]|nr:metal-dependent hydrolase [Chloroflexota bacterium]
MNTPSHLIINAAIHKKANRRDIPQSAFLWGSVMPDIPLGLLSVGSFVYYRYIVGQNLDSLMPKMFDDLYFNNPWWIAAHNFLHSPVALFTYLAFFWRYRKQPGRRGHWWLWFVLGCMVHTSIDILTHVNDGPVLFWPLDWQTRFHSIISYYDPAYFGLQFTFFELALDIVLLGYLFLPDLIKRFTKHSAV